MSDHPIFDIISKCTTFPWDVEANAPDADPILREIVQSLTHEVQVTPHYQQSPNTFEAAQLIALPSIFYMKHTMTLAERNQPNPWFDKLTEEERQAVDDYYGFVDNHRKHLHLSFDEQEHDAFASWMAACFAFTVQRVPIVADLREIIEAVHNHTLQKPHPAIDILEKRALLVVKRPMGSFRGVTGITGDIATIISRRTSKRRATVFLDVLREPMTSKVMVGEEPDRDDLKAMVQKSPIADSMMESHMTGFGTYVTTNIEPMKALNECNLPVFI